MFFSYNKLPVSAHDRSGVIPKLTDFGYFPYGGSSENEVKRLDDAQSFPPNTRPEDLLRQAVEDEQDRLSYNPIPCLQGVLDQVLVALDAPKDGSHIQEAAKALMGLWSCHQEESVVNATDPLVLPKVRVLVDAIVNLNMVIPT